MILNYNIIAYIIYLAATLFVILRVGDTLYRSGKPFLLMCLNGNAALSASINRILLMGYYLINTGYAIITLRIWEKVSSMTEIAGVLSYKLGLIVLMLGAMHLINVSCLLAIRGRITKEHMKMLKKEY